MIARSGAHGKPGTSEPRCSVVDTSESENVSAAGTANVTLCAPVGLSEQEY